MKVTIKPINSRFKRLIREFGSEWLATNNPAPMHCFNGMLGLTCIPATGIEKWSNFRLAEVEVSP